MIEVCDLCFAYGEFEVLKGISFTIQKGEVVGVLGPNGAGKTTLLRCLNHVLVPSGEVRIAGENLASLSRQRIAQLVGMVPQHSVPLFPFTIEEFVLMGRYARRSAIFWTDGDRDIARNYIEHVGLGGMEQRRITEISGGQYQRALLARALAQEPYVLLLDEPTLHLDLKARVEFVDLLKSLVGKFSLTVLFVSHNLSLAGRLGMRFIMLLDGRIVKDGAREEVFTPELLEKAYGVCVKVQDEPFAVIPL